MRSIIPFIISLLCIVSVSGQKVSLTDPLQYDMKGWKVDTAMKKIEKDYNWYFFYTSELGERFQDQIISKRLTTLEALLDFLLDNYNIESNIIRNQIILKGEPVPKYTVASGWIRDSETNQPIAFSTISLKGRPVGEVADREGYFQLLIKDARYNDTLIFSILGYKVLEMSMNNFLLDEDSTFFLEPEPIEIPALTVKARHFKTIETGNSKWFPQGSMYLDTHGQQAALFIENEDYQDAVIMSVKCYLSKNGNTSTPFRLHLYRRDTITGKPGNNLLEYGLIVYPENAKGWYTIPLENYHIDFPGEGLFIALEGVYPDEQIERFSEETADTSEFVSEDEELSVSYGQRIGFSKIKLGKNNTWHYSMSRTWFQLSKQPFSIMISAELRTKKSKFSNRKNE